MPDAARSLCALVVALGVAHPAASAAPRGPAVEESAAERRAVRGGPVEDATVAESPELREVRRFEEEAFPRDRSVATPAAGTTDDAAPDGELPKGLEGRWGGSGDIPSELRSPESTRGTGRPTPAPPAEWLRDLAAPDLPVR